MQTQTDEELIELYEERCAIREYDGGMDRKSAERAAYFDLRKIIGPGIPVPQYIIDKAAIVLR